MCGAYIGVDEYRSKLAVLRERFESSSTANAVAPNVGTDSTLAADGGRSVWSDAL